MKNIKKYVAVVVCCCCLTLAAPKQPEAGGIPVFDGVSLGQAITDFLNQIGQLGELVAIYENVHGYYVMYEEARAEWQAIVDQADLEALLTEFGNGALRESRSGDLEEIGIEPDVIFGSEHTEARRMYEKNGEFIHTTIKKINEIHATISTRQDTIAALGEQVSTKTTEKEFLQMQTMLMVEQLAMQNEQQMISLLQIEADMGTRALNLEESASANIKHGVM